MKSNGLPAVVVHYLDDFLIVLPEKHDLSQYSDIFAGLCTYTQSIQISLNLTILTLETPALMTLIGTNLDSVYQWVHRMFRI